MIDSSSAVSLAPYRAGTADPDTFGLSVVDEAGDWWIAGNLMRDAAALRNLELLPWDCWGAMPGPDEPIDTGPGHALDRLAPLTQSPDAKFAELQEHYDGDDRLRVPRRCGTHSAGREETI